MKVKHRHKDCQGCFQVVSLNLVDIDETQVVNVEICLILRTHLTIRTQNKFLLVLVLGRIMNNWLECCTGRLSGALCYYKELVHQMVMEISCGSYYIQRNNEVTISHLLLQEVHVVFSYSVLAACQ